MSCLFCSRKWEGNDSEPAAHWQWSRREGRGLGSCGPEFSGRITETEPMGLINILTGGRGDGRGELQMGSKLLT